MAFMLPIPGRAECSSQTRRGHEQCAAGMMSRVTSPLRDLDRSLLSGLAWTGAARWVTQIVSWVITLFIARLLTPSDFGVLTLAQLPVELVALVSEFGVGTAVVTLRDLSTAQLAQLNTFCVVLGVFGFLVASALALPLAHFFAAPELPPVLMVVATSLVVTSLRIVPSASLQRD